MKFTIAQLNPKIADFDSILKKINLALAEAVKDQSDCVVFPELFLCGYPPLDALFDSNFKAKLKEAELELLTLSKLYPVGILMGLPRYHDTDHSKGIKNAAILIENGKILFEWEKQLLPYYDVFNEPRYFDSGIFKGSYEFRGKRLVVSICEDAWFSENSAYLHDPFSQVNASNTHLMINLSASPFELKKFERRLEVFKRLAIRLQVPVLCVNQVAGQDELVFDGQSFGLNKNGNILFQCEAFKEEIKTVDLSVIESLKTPLMPLDELQEALVLGLKDYVYKSGFSRCILGLSGGIDSALTAVLAVKALGADNVVGLLMPSQYSSEGSITDAQELAKNLAIRHYILPISDTFEVVQRTLTKVEQTLHSLTLENVQSRIRGQLAMAFAAQHKALVLSTGNKSEISVGYCTLYGDMCGGVSVLGDLYKTQVYALAQHIFDKEGLIPKNSITKPPSAELRPNQTDQDSLPPYDILDSILEGFIEKTMSIDELVTLGFEKSQVEWVYRQLNQQEFKRFQASPIVRVSSKSFGVGRRYPLVWKG